MATHDYAHGNDEDVIRQVKEEVVEEKVERR